MPDKQGKPIKEGYILTHRNGCPQVIHRRSEAQLRRDRVDTILLTVQEPNSIPDRIGVKFGLAETKDSRKHQRGEARERRNEERRTRGLPVKDKVYNKLGVIDSGLKFEPGEISYQMAKILPMLSWEKPLTAEAKIARVREYFEYCFNNDVRPSIPGLSFAEGISVSQFNEIAFRQTKDDRAVADEYLKSRMFINILLEQFTETSKINPVVGIFLLKNHFGYKDVQEHKVVAEDPYGTILNRSELAEKYREALPDDTE